jgi:copper chaperone NosL
MSNPIRKTAREEASFLLRVLPFILVLIGLVLLVTSLRFPLWEMRLEAPQYRDEEALRVAVYPSKFGGDMREISVLDQYIGVHVPPTLPQFKWLPPALIASAVLGLVLSLLRRSLRSRGLVCLAVGLTIALVIAAVQAQLQIHDIGHKRDHKTVLVGVRDFTPPFLGTSKIAQFTVSSTFGAGAWMIGGALALQIGAAWLGRKPLRNGEAITGAETKPITKKSCNPPSARGGLKTSAVSL